MSRIGKKPIQIPAGVTVHVAESVLSVKGPKGELAQAIHPRVSMVMEENKVMVSVKNPKLKQDKALWGLFARLAENMVQGVTEGFEKRLEINGVGYRAVAEGAKLDLSLGFSHPVKFALPQGITATVEKNIISIRGIDKQLVGETAARIRALKKPEPYKGKGIKYVGEIIRRKAGKQVKAAGAGAGG